jgi:propionyl-CoA carboxylase alpha chain
MLFAWAPTRHQAADLLADALERSRIHGLVTNRHLLAKTLRHKAFRDGDTDTAFFDRHGLAALATPAADDSAVELSAFAAALALDAGARRDASVLARIPSGWRNVPSQAQRVEFDGRTVEYRRVRAALVLDGREDVVVVSADPDEVVLDADGVRRRFAVAVYGEEVDVDSPLGAVRLRLVPRFVDPADQVAAGSLLAPMPGSIARLAVSVGDAVTAGQPILWLEAMKMQHQINAPADGTISELPVREGQQIDVGAVLAVVTSEE